MVIVVCFEGVGLVALFCAKFGLLVVPLVLFAGFVLLVVLLIVFAGFVLVFLVFFIGERIGHLDPKIGCNSDIVFANAVFCFILTYFRFVLVVFIVLIVFIVVLTKANSSVQIPVFLTGWFVVFITAVLVLTKSRGKGSFLLVAVASVLEIRGA